MPWVKLDDHFPDHEKLAQCGDWAPLCGWLYVCALAFSNRQLTDGRIPKPHIFKLVNYRHIQIVTGGIGKGKDALAQFTDDVDVEKLAACLVGVGLWEEDDTDYLIHDYLDFQPSRATVLAERDRLREIGRKGGLSRGAKLGAKPEAKLVDKQDAKPEAKLNLKPVPVPVPLASSIEDARRPRATLVKKRDPNSPFDWLLPVPLKLHQQWVGRESTRTNGDTAAAENVLLDWYSRVAGEWNERHLPGDDEFDFWRKRYAEWRGVSPSLVRPTEQSRPALPKGDAIFAGERL